MSWEERAKHAEANLTALKGKVIPLVEKTKELEKEVKKWKTMYEMQSSDSPVTKGGTIRKNPSHQQKFVLADGTELTNSHLEKLTKDAADQKARIEMLELQNDFLTTYLRKVALTQYMTKELQEDNVDNLPEAMLSIKRFIDTVNEEMDLFFQQQEGKKPEQDRIDRISTLKRENERLAEGYEKEAQSKSSYKKELKATKKMAKQALKRVAELEQEMKHDASKHKKEKTELKVEIHNLKKQLAEGGGGSAKEGTKTPKGSHIKKRLEEESGRGRSGSVSEAMSGISTISDDQVIEGGVGQKIVQMKEKKAAAYAHDKKGRYETMTGLDGEIKKTNTGLTVIDTNKKVEKMVAHEMNVAKISVIEGRNLTPKKMPKHGIEVWLRLEMGSAVFQTPPRKIMPDETGDGIPWSKDYSYVISTGLQSKPLMPLTVYYCPLNKHGQSDGDGKELGAAAIPLTTFLPLIGTTESVMQWVPITDKDSEVCGLVQVVMQVESNVSRSERMIPKESGFSKSTLKENIVATQARSGKIMGDEAPLEEFVDLNPLQQKASKANPNVEEICGAILDGAKISPDWKNFRKQSWVHFAAMGGNDALLKKLRDALSADLKAMDTTDKAGFSPFMYAVMAGHLNTCKFLKAIKTVNVNRTDWNGNTPLHLASMYGRANLIEFLVHECGNSVDQQDENAATPLHHAAFNGNKECVEALCKFQAMVDAEDRDGNSPLLLSLVEDHREASNYLCIEKKADIGSFNTRGDTCLWATIQTHNDDMMNLLLKDQRTDLSRKLGHYDSTLLMRCLLQLDSALCDKVVGIILSQKPDVNLQNKLGMTALFYAVAMNRPNMVTFLTMACGALVKVKDKSGNTPLHFCNNESIAKTLIQNGADQQVNLSNVEGNTPLHCAFAFGGPAVADIMLSAGGDTTKKNNNGLTPADCVLVDQKYITLPFYEEDFAYEHSIFIGKELMKNRKVATPAKDYGAPPKSEEKESPPPPVLKEASQAFDEMEFL